MAPTKTLLLAGWALPVFADLVVPPKADLATHGPIYQVAKNSSFKAFEDAAAKATEAINKIIATGNSSFGPFDSETTSFSLSVFNAFDDKPLYEFHFEAPGLNGSYTKGKLSEDTIYRSGSLGKLMTVYTFLVDIGDDIFTDPVTKYIVSYRACLVVIYGHLFPVRLAGTRERTFYKPNTFNQLV